ncbi:MAG TPA: hypothetical protein VHG92_11445 [Afifellaceae bacterium]|nr:hypothetical protein [Afifellaceae bacterium]
MRSAIVHLQTEPVSLDTADRGRAGKEGERKVKTPVGCGRQYQGQTAGVPPAGARARAEPLSFVVTISVV